MGSKPTLLLLHGVTMSARAWADVIPDLTDHYDVIAPTAVGHRGGPQIAGTATIGGLTDHIERVLDARELKRVHIAGNSMGGWIAIELARRGRADTVCALSPAGFWASGKNDATHATNRIRRSVRLAQVTLPVAPVALRIGVVRRAALRDIAEHGEILTATQALDIARDAANCGAARDLLGTAERVEPLDPLPCPITLAWSAHDRIFPPAVNGTIARERLPQAEYVVLPAVGHVPMIDNPRLCVRTIRAAAQQTR
ncbi:alpha/beta fold hydrolase [Mycobacterium sp. 1423905.2]|uniref:alpha/beta fold hydrolase n=1 Tax=Mycobacterium sp. 1423905.2 TaxID=1856859 RepID=UPI0007FBB02C|nr:alpha/beta hydrolase [Mycobacterium sp. 1423905.2]OBJ52375.1 hydrolase [Mycobacterium sp. 1423905.2]